MVKILKRSFYVKNLVKRFVYWLCKMCGCGNTGLYLSVWMCVICKAIKSSVYVLLIAFSVYICYKYEKV
jgi:hypothetical protein